MQSRSNDALTYIAIVLLRWRHILGKSPHWGDYSNYSMLAHDLNQGYQNWTCEWNGEDNGSMVVKQLKL